MHHNTNPSRRRAARWPLARACAIIAALGLRRIAAALAVATVIYVDLVAIALLLRGAAQ